MKAKNKSKKSIIALITVFMLLTAAVPFLGNNIAYAQENNTANLVNTTDYILQNIDTNYANPNKMEVADLISVKQTLADGNILKDIVIPEGESLIQAMYNTDESARAFITMNEVVMVMYNTDDESDYYVAYVDTMHNNSSSNVVDYVFAYTDLYGNVINDAIYDDNTGLAYIPKKYKEEDKNGQGMLNVQIQLLQSLDASNLNTTVKTIVNKSSDISGQTIETGYQDISILDTNINIEIAKDFGARRSIASSDVLIKINGMDYEDYVYNSQTGILTIEGTVPLAIDSLEISIDKNNNAEVVDTSVESHMSPYSLADGLDKTADTVWKVEGTPVPGYYVLNDVKIKYFTGAGNRESYINNPYNMGNLTNQQMQNLVSVIRNGGTISKIVDCQTFMSWQLQFDSDYTFNCGGVNITIPSSVWDIKCAEGATSFGNINMNPGVGNTVHMRIFEVNEAQQWVLMGIVTPKCTTQAGAALFKVRYETAGGFVKINKKDNHGNYIANVRIHIWNNEGTYNQTITTGNGEYDLGRVPTGTYNFEELDVPTNMITTTSLITNKSVPSGSTVTVDLTDSYQRGAVTLTKYDSDNEGATKGDATIAGAKFNLYAATEINEGAHHVYSQDQLIRENIETRADGTTDTISDLPIGSYYYVETKAPTGFVVDTERKYAEVTYAAGQPNANTGAIRVGNKPQYFDVSLKKRLSGTMHDAEKDLSGVQFTATLISDPTQSYLSSVTGADGSCSFSQLPYGQYTISETTWPISVYEPVSSWDVSLSEGSPDLSGTVKVNTSKNIRVEINKEILLREGEATDAVVSGAEFTIYRDPDCRIVECVLPLTDANGYAISDEIWAGTYYMKETKFPTGIDPDAVIPGEDVTYRNKVYTIDAGPEKQTERVKTYSYTIQNEPNRNHIEIIKDIGETSNTPQFPIDQCEFTATLKSTIGTDHVFSRKCTAQTRREDGYCIIEDLPYGTYVIEETKVSPITLKCANFELFVEKDKKVKKVPYEPADGNFLATTLGEFVGTTKDYSTSYEWLDDEGHIVDVPKVMEIKIRKVDYDRTDVNPVYYTQGDAQLKGAIYEIYRYDPETDDYSEKVYNITVDHQDEEGYWCAKSRDLLVGKYMVKEKIKNTEVIDGVTYDYSYAPGYLVDPNTYYFEQRPDLQTVRKTFQTQVSKEKVVRGQVHVIKYDNEKKPSTDGNDDPSAEVPSKGAILRLVLDSSIPEGAKLEEGKETDYYSQGTIYYDVTIDKDGYGNIIDRNDASHNTAVKTCYGDAYYPSTIPWGKYTLIEVRESDKKLHTSFFIQPEAVEIRHQHEKQYRIEADDPVPMFLKVQKRDKDTGATVELANSQFKVWDCENERFVTHMSYDDHSFIDVFTTNEEGIINTPEKLLSGGYIIYEVHSPEEYYLEDDLRLPSNPNDYGDITKGGKYVLIDKAAMEVKENTISNSYDYFYTVDMSDRPLMSTLEIIKKGEMLTSVTSQTTRFGEQYTPVWTERGLKGVKYDIIAAKDIKSPDGRITYVAQGTKVDTITTDDNGIAKTKELYPGEYRIVEVETPKGYLTDNNISNVVLESSHNELVRVKNTQVNLTNVRQKLMFTFPKQFENVKYATSEDYKPSAIFGVYTNQEFRDCNGNVVLTKNKLVDLITADEMHSNVRSNIDLPAGKYYAMELEATYPYVVSIDTVDMELDYTNHVDEFVVKEYEAVSNNYDKAALSLFKISTSELTNFGMIGDKVDVEGKDIEFQELLDKFSRMTEEEILDYIKTTGLKTISGAIYGIYVDEACTQQLYVKGDDGAFTPARLVTDGSGIVKLEDLPLGLYYLKELKAPTGYQLSNDVISVELTPLNKDGLVYRALSEHSVVGGLLSKTDIFTGEPIPNCIFEITNSEDEVLMHATTDVAGNAFIPTDLFVNGETYYYTEIEAPEIYNLNTTPHKFVAEIDENGKWVAEPIAVENLRKESTVTLTKLDMIDGTPIPNCKFELRSLETDFAVEGVTDENGIYVFENIPYGKYTYTELEAPEEWLIDTTPHEITIDAEDIQIVAKDERNPDTGDIAVVALSIVALVSVVGIAFIIIKNKKQVRN